MQIFTLAVSSGYPTATPAIPVGREKYANEGENEKINAEYFFKKQQ